MDPQRFEVRPDASALEEFLAHLRLTGKPHTFRDHLHIRPAQSAKPVLLVSYRIPDEFAKDPSNFAPCPICVKDAPKYARGMWVWFPESDGGDGYCRAIGRDCGRRYFGKDVWATAEAVLARQQDEAADRAYLLANVQHLATLTKAFPEVVMEWARLHALKTEFISAVSRRVAKDLERSKNNDGWMTETKNVTSYTPDGKRLERPETRKIARIRGAAFLADRTIRAEEEPERIAQALNRVAARYSELSAQNLGSLTAEEAAELAGIMRAAKGAALQVRELLALAKLFLSTDNLTALRQWSASSSSPSVRIRYNEVENNIEVLTPTRGARSRIDWTVRRRLQMPEFGSSAALDRLSEVA